MAGLDFVLVLQVVFFMTMIWAFGRVFTALHAPAILGQLAAGIVFGPQLLDMVVYASDGMCSTDLRKDPYEAYINGPNYDDGCDDSGSAANVTGRMLAGGGGGHQCDHFTWNRWENDGHIISIWQARRYSPRSPPSRSPAPPPVHTSSPLSRDAARPLPTPLPHAGPCARGRSSWATSA